MVRKLDIGEDLQHPGWSADVPEVVRPSGLQPTSADVLHDWVVQLVFRRDGGVNYGSGFFINIPSASHDVILTAAHNLIGPKDNLSTDLSVLMDGGTVPVPMSNVRICEAYKVKQTPVADYGAILLPRNGGSRGGFGFSLKLGFEEHIKGDLRVHGYRAPQQLGQVGQLLESSGPCVGCYNQQLEYRAATEQGISGSPVWMEYQGRPTVVAIHNHRPTRPRAGSRGSRVTRDLLREVFDWVTVGEYGVRLRAQGKKASPPPPRGLYLSFSEGFAFGRVRLGGGTKFDVWLAQVTSEKELYALAVGHKWAMFNPVRKEIVLTERLKDGCLFEKKNISEKKKSMRIVVENGGKYFQLRMQGTRIREIDGDDAESSEVSMVNYPDDNKDLFTEFWFGQE